MLPGFVSGMGAATADAVYGCTAAFGLSVISSAIDSCGGWLELACGFLLIGFGLRAMHKHSVKERGVVETRSLIGAYLSTFILTITNPVTIIAFAALFSALGLAGDDEFGGAVVVGGVFAGSMLWWLILSGVTHRVRDHLPDGFVKWTSIVSGILLSMLGLAAIVRFAYQRLTGG
jgi:threonine/homoserine/homoserine lactone efflux protein